MKPFVLALALLFGSAGFASAQSDDIFRQVYLGSYNTVVRLVESDPYYLNAREPNTGRTPLMVAADAGKFDLVIYFVQKKADLNVVDAQGSPAVRWAAMAGHKEIAQYLIDKGAKPEFIAAVVLGDTNTVAKTLRAQPAYADPPVQGIVKPVLLASRNDHLEVMRLLLTSGANVASRTKDGDMMIHEAAQRDRPDQVALLLKHGADINARNGKDDTPLHLAAEFASPAMVKLLLENGADPRLKDWRRATPFHAAIIGDQLENFKLLLATDPEINDVCEEGSPLHIAIWQHGNIEMVKLLLDREANVELRDRRNKTPLDLAVLYRHPEIAKLLREKGAKEHRNVFDSLGSSRSPTVTP